MGVQVQLSLLKGLLGNCRLLLLPFIFGIGLLEMSVHPKIVRIRQSKMVQKHLPLEVVVGYWNLGAEPLPKARKLRPRLHKGFLEIHQEGHCLKSANKTTKRCEKA